MIGRAMDAGDDVLVVISYYDRRTTDCLVDLLNSIDNHVAGRNFEVLVVVNQTRETLPEIPQFRFRVTVMGRENTGMNIGAWEGGWRSIPNRSTYVFMQDECLVVRDGWLSAYCERCEEPSIGLTGESINLAWSRPWKVLRAAHAGARLPDHLIDGNPADRVDVYLHCLKGWGIDPGPTATHLRSLVWVASYETLERIGGFPIGTNYGDCIAAEIAVSRKIEAAGLRLAQARQVPFHFVVHREWNQDIPGGSFLNGKSPARDATWDLTQRHSLDSEAEQALAMLGPASDAADHVLLTSALLAKLRDRDAQIEILQKQLAQADARKKART